MKRIFLMGVKQSVCFFALCLIFPSLSTAQLRDIEEERFRLQVPEVTPVKDGAPGERKQKHQDKEIRYVAGKDKKWFSRDDEVNHYYLKDVDENGKITKHSYILPGKDKAAFTADDELQEYQVFYHSPEGKVKKEVSFDGKKRKQYTAEYIYSAQGKKTDVRRYDVRGKEIRHIKYTCDGKGLVLQDEEYVQGKLEKYHRYEYDDKGRLKRAVEYLVDKNGEGPDGTWFTPDDIISSAKEYFYDADGDTCKDKKYIGIGPDGKWFTPDDEMQYYTLSEF